MITVPEGSPHDAGARAPLSPELWGLLGLAFLLRLPGIFSFDLWQDEIYSIYEAKYLYRSPIGPGGMELRPLYFLLLHPLADAFPKATALLRLPSLVFGVAGIVATWLLTRRYAGRPAAFVATLTVTLLPFHLNASQLIRWIAMVILIGAMLTHAIIRAMETDETKHHVITLLLLLAGSLTHITFLMPQTGLALGAHLIRDDGRVGFRLPTKRALLQCWLPYLAILGANYGVLFALVPRARLLGDTTGGAPGRLLPAVMYYLTPALIAAAAVGAWWLFTWGTTAQRRIAAMMALGLGIPTLVMQLGGLRNMIPVSVLYLAAALPVFLVTVGAAVNALTEERRAARAAILLGFVLAASLVPGTLSHLLDGSGFEFRRPLQAIQQQDPGAAVLVYPVIHARWEVPELEAVEFSPPFNTDSLEMLRRARARFWVIAPLRRSGLLGDRDGSKFRWIQRHCSLQGTYRRARFDYERFDTELYRCEREGP